MTTREMILFGAVIVLASTTLSLFFTTLNPWHGPGPRPMHAFMPGGPEGEGAGDFHGPRGPDGERKDHISFGERMMLRADANKDGFLTKTEMLEDNRQFVERLFNEADTDKDGKLSAEEMKKGREALRNKMKTAAQSMVHPAIQPSPTAE